ncbi:MAG TPA: CopD family protein [Thermoanaerobaculia bacterium]|nr:CopD family protein [Thermoanaerobaculia bacterium]
MNVYPYILLVHVLGATIWTGGHLVLATRILPEVLRKRSASMLLDFEKRYELLGMSALAAQIATGLWLAQNLLPFNLWLSLGNPYSRLILLKLSCLALTAAFAADAQLRVLPKLRDETVHKMVPHIVSVTILGILFVVAGVGFRTGGWS